VKAADGQYVVCGGHAIAARAEITDAKVLAGTPAWTPHGPRSAQANPR
jgi:hypothetical protein